MLDKRLLNGNGQADNRISPGRGSVTIADDSQDPNSGAKKGGCC